MQNVDNDDFFVRYLGPALDEAVTGRDLEIVQLRFGLSSGDTLTLRELGDQFNVSRERIRQILNRVLSRVHFKAKKQLKLSNEHSCSAQLVAHIEQIILPNDKECVERLVEFCRNSLNHLNTSTHAIPLVASLIFPKRVAVQLIARARAYARESRRIKAFEYQKKVRGLIVSERFQNLTNYITWNDARHQFAHIEPTGVRRARNVSDEAKNSGLFYSEKMQRGVQYESTLELDFFTQLEQVDQVIWYQEQPFGIPYSCDGSERTYYPDVLIALRADRYVVVEIKPCFWMPLRINRLKWDALNKYCAENGLGVLITDGHRSIQEAKNRSVNVQFASEILNRLKLKCLTWREYKEIAQRHNASSAEFVALVLHAKLNWSLCPFQLSGATDQS
ncbi:hypothetical protein BH10CYA1_BH10CYA1_56820 [soil metagenome]